MTYGPITRVDGPPPVAPKYGLIQAGLQATTGVRIVADDDRWMLGAEIYPYSPDTGGVFDGCATGTAGTGPKGFGTEIENPQFSAITAYVADTCSSWQVPDQEAYKARAAMVLAAIESGIVSHELLTGDAMPTQPHLADGEGTFPTGDSVLGLVEGIAALEEVIAASLRQGVIHLSPMAAIFLNAAGVLDSCCNDGVLRTVTGNLVIPDAGYAEGAAPPEHPDATGSQEWIYASGPVDIRRSEIFTNPDNVREALDRGSGATNDRPNRITYRAERYYLLDWDTAVQGAVLVDRCQQGCAEA